MVQCLQPGECGTDHARRQRGHPQGRGPGRIHGHRPGGRGGGPAAAVLPLTSPRHPAVQPPRHMLHAVAERWTPCSKPAGLVAAENAVCFASVELFFRREFLQQNLSPEPSLLIDTFPAA
eukprot:EG_transcript_38706